MTDSLAVIALGSNLGDRAATLDSAVTALDALAGCRVEAVSSWHGTVALTVDGLDPDRPAYLNGVLLLRTELTPHELLDALRVIEQSHGRERAERWGDRTLDLDLIAVDDLVITSPELEVPHPRAHERDFVLAPWLEVQPDAVVPGRGAVAELHAALQPLESTP